MAKKDKEAPADDSEKKEGEAAADQPKKGLIGKLLGNKLILFGGIGALAVPALLYRSSRSWWLMNYYLFLPNHLPANRRGIVPDESEDI